MNFVAHQWTLDGPGCCRLVQQFHWRECPPGLLTAEVVTGTSAVVLRGFMPCFDQATLECDLGAVALAQLTGAACGDADLCGYLNGVLNRAMATVYGELAQRYCVPFQNGAGTGPLFPTTVFTPATYVCGTAQWAGYWGLRNAVVALVNYYLHGEAYTRDEAPGWVRAYKDTINWLAKGNLLGVLECDAPGPSEVVSAIAVSVHPERRFPVDDALAMQYGRGTSGGWGRAGAGFPRLIP